MCPPLVESLEDAEEAGRYVRLLVERSGSEKVNDVLDQIGRKVGIGRWAVWGFYHGKRKTAGKSVIARLRQVYLATCERELNRLENEIAIERAMGREDAALGDIAAKVQALSVEVRAARRK